jgi:hypothetical protein
MGAVHADDPVEARVGGRQDLAPAVGRGRDQLRSSVYALPNREECVEVFERISRELEELGGQATSRMAIPRCGWRTTWTRRARCSTA